MKCPRCGGKLWPDGDPDYGLCLLHGSQYIGPPPLSIPRPDMTHHKYAPHIAESRKQVLEARNRLPKTRFWANP